MDDIIVLVELEGFRIIKQRIPENYDYIIQHAHSGYEQAKPWVFNHPGWVYCLFETHECITCKARVPASLITIGKFLGD